MFETILIPVDLTDKSRVAVDAVAGLADPERASIHLLHVIETIQDVPFEELDAFYASLRKRAERAVNRWADELGERGFRVERDIAFGRRGPEIVRHAEDRACDLIVLASHPYDREQPGRGVGTLSHQVALLAPCPVLLMR